MTPLERAAAAVREEMCAYRCAYRSADMWMTEGGRRSDNDFTDIARAALAAIREDPGEAVRRAMRETVPVTGHEWEIMEREELGNGMVIDPMLEHWQAMIDAALAEEE